MLFKNEQIDHNVLDGTVYYYYVRAYSSAYDLDSGWSKPVAVTTIAHLDAPESLSGRTDRG